MQYLALFQRFRNVIVEYNGALEKFREKNKECIEKQMEYGEYM